MAERPREPPSPQVGQSKKGSDLKHGPGRLKPEQCEIKVRWERARKVLEVSAVGVTFEFATPLKVGIRYPISLTGPGVSISSTLEVRRCQLTLDPAEGRFFRVEGRFFPYME